MKHIPPRKIVKRFKRDQSIPYKLIHHVKKPVKLLKRLARMGGTYNLATDSIVK